jgi:hypothetical protein
MPPQQFCIMQKVSGTVLTIIVGFLLNRSLVNDSKTNPAKRETVEAIANETGIVKIIGKGETAIYMIDCPAKYLRLNVYNMPENFKNDGVQVQFSGNIKANSTLEDDFGEIFEITAIAENNRLAVTP